MSTLAKEQIVDIIRGKVFKSIGNISAYLKDIFKNLI